MKRTDDFAQMVEKADVEASKKTVAMNLVDACRSLENGGAADIGSLSHAFLAMVPLQLEQYLTQIPSEDRIIACIRNQTGLLIAKHAANCPDRRGGDEQSPIGINWKRLSFATLSRAGTPGVLLFFGIVYHAEIKAILLSIAGG